MIGETVVLAQSEKEFKAAVDASKGESLGGEDRFQSAIANASSGSFADVYVDIGGIIDQSEGGETADQAKGALQATGIDPSEATAVASVIPQANQIVVDLSSELSGEKAPAGDASKLLGTLASRPALFAAFSTSEFQQTAGRSDRQSRRRRHPAGPEAGRTEEHPGTGGGRPRQNRWLT